MSPVASTVQSVTDTSAPLSHLREMLGPDASFRPGQLEAIEAVARDRGRVLLVQRTGWGKSAVYFIATKLLREQGAGPTLLVSPLLALMRNQIEMAARIGVRAETINSTNPDEFEPIVQRLGRRRDRPAAGLARAVRQRALPRRDAPASSRARSACSWSTRRTASATGATTSVPTTGASCACSRRCRAGVPVLCTTATANDRVIADITDQLGDDLRDLPRHARPREPRAAPSSTCPAQAERLAWLADDDPRRSTARASSTAHRSPTPSGSPRSCAARASRPRPTAAPPTTTTASASSRRCSRTS